MKYILILLLVMLFTALNAELTFTAYPYAAYTSETRLMAGAFSFFRYNFAESDEPVHAIDLLANTIYSQNKQFVVALIPRYRRGSWSLESSLQFEDWPDSFYGIGNHTDSDVSESFTTRMYASELALRYRLSQILSVSALSNIGAHRLRGIQPGGMLEAADVPGKDESFFSGLGLGILLDTTDGSYYPLTGLKLEGKQIWYHSSLGSDFDFRKTSLDFRLFHPLSSKQVLAAQTDLEMNYQEVPFYLYPQLGDRLRAYDTKRFIDKVRISQRLEHRHFPFEGKYSGRLGFVVFTEFGQVAQSTEYLRLEDTHWSLGGGLRFSILPRERLNLRADLGIGKDSFNVMINAREVF